LSILCSRLEQSRLEYRFVAAGQEAHMHMTLPRLAAKVSHDFGFSLRAALLCQPLGASMTLLLLTD
jgi:hypothetical protein